MQDEPNNPQQADDEVEAHLRRGAYAPSEDPELRIGRAEEDEEEDEVEAHLRRGA